jgi:hypothetical protein
MHCAQTRQGGKDDKSSSQRARLPPASKCCHGVHNCRTSKLTKDWRSKEKMHSIFAFGQTNIKWHEVGCPVEKASVEVGPTPQDWHFCDSWNFVKDQQSTINSLIDHRVTTRLLPTRMAPNPGLFFHCPSSRLPDQLRRPNHVGYKKRRVLNTFRSYGWVKKKREEKEIENGLSGFEPMMKLSVSVTSPQRAKVRLLERRNKNPRIMQILDSPPPLSAKTFLRIMHIREENLTHSRPISAYVLYRVFSCLRFALACA